MRMMAMLKALLPSSEPTARSKAPMRTAATAVASSGNEVEKARKEAPTKDSPSCASRAMPSAASTRNGAETRMTSAAAPNLARSHRIE